MVGSPPVGAPYDDHVRMLLVGTGTGSLGPVRLALNPELPRQFLRERVVVVLPSESSQQRSEEGAPEMGAQTQAAHERQRPRTMGVHHFLQAGRDLGVGLLPGDSLEAVAHPLQGVGEPVGMVLEMRDRQPLPAGVPLTAGGVLVGSHLRDAVALRPNLQAAVGRAERTGRLLPVVHDSLLSIVLSAGQSQVDSSPSSQKCSPGDAPLEKRSLGKAHGGEALFAKFACTNRLEGGRWARGSDRYDGRFC